MLSDLSPNPSFTETGYPAEYEGLNKPDPNGFPSRMSGVEARLEELEEQVRFLRRELLRKGA